MAYKIYAGATFNGSAPVGGYVIHDLYRENEFRIADDAVINYHASLSPDILTFTLSPNHPNQILEKFKTSIFVTDDGDVIFRGRIIDSTQDFYNRVTYTCESDKAFLCDSIVRPFAFNGSIRQFLQLLINNHNEMVVEGNWRNFKLGNVTVTDLNDYIVRSSETPMTTFACINDKLIKLLGGYIRIRRSGLDYYIDYLSDFTENSGQRIEFGKNLLDIEQYTDASGLVNCLYPYGSKIESDDSSYMTKEDVIAQAAAGNGNFYHGNRVTISGANDNVDVVLNPYSILEYGRVWGIKEWNDVTLSSNLLSKARSAISGNTISKTITVTAVDLHGSDADINRITVGQYVECYSIPHGITTQLTCTDKKLNLLNPEQNTIKLGTEIKSLTGSVSHNGTLGALNSVDGGTHKCDRAIAVSEDYTKLVFNEKHALKVSATGASAISRTDSNNGTQAWISDDSFDVETKSSGNVVAQVYGSADNAHISCGGSSVMVNSSGAFLNGKRFEGGSASVKYAATNDPIYTTIKFVDCGIKSFSSPPIVITNQVFSSGNIVVSETTKDSFKVSTTKIGTETTVKYKQFDFIAIGS